jgi:Glycosyltransferase family 87
VQDHNHLDTYGPITYLAYLPFEVIFPLHNLRHDYLPAAHAAAVTFDLITIGGLLLLGRQLRGGEEGRRLGLVLAVAWAACPFTFLGLVANTNDGLVPMFVVAALVAISSPVRRGLLLGLGAAAKFAPLLLAGVFATAGGDRGRRSLQFALAMAAAIAVPVLVYSRPGGLGVFWSQTLGFQMHRHSFLSIWGQYPQLNPLKAVLEAGTIALAAAAAAVASARRTTAQVGALAGAILIALELTATHWYFFYVGWFVPGALLALLALDRRGLPLPVSSAGSAEALESSITLRLPEPALRQ